MKKLQLIAVLTMAGLAISTLPTKAFENYVATGHPYAPGDDRLPPLNSEQDRINLQTDIYESELYTKQRERKIFESELFRLRNDLSLNPPDLRLEY